MKKLIALFLCAVTVISMAACSAKTEATEAAAEVKTEAAATEAATEAAAAETTAEKEPVKIRFIHWQTEIVDQFQGVIDEFQAQYPYITIEQEVIPTSDYSSVTAAYIAGNDALDIMGVEPWCDGARQTPGFYENNFLMSLEDLDCVKNYDPAMLNDNVRTDGVLTSLPISQHTMFVFYNKDIFAQYGLEEPKTYSEFLHICDVLTENGVKLMCAGEKDGWPLTNMACDTYWSALGREGGESFYENIWNNGKTLEEVGYRDAVKPYYDITIRDGWYGDVMATAYDDAPVIFATGKCAMYADGSWSSVQISDVEPDFEVGMFGLNVTDDPAVKFSPSKFGMTLGIASRTKYPEECRMFLEFLFEKERYTQFCNDCMYTPCEKDTVVADPMVQKIVDFMATRDVVPFSALYSARMKVADPNYSFDNEEAVQGIVMGEYDLDQAMASMQEQIDTNKKAARK